MSGMTKLMASLLGSGEEKPDQVVKAIGTEAARREEQVRRQAEATSRTPQRTSLAH